MRVIRLMAAIVAALLALLSDASARLIRVPFDVPLLQDACYAAFAGDTVGVYAGTYEAIYAPIRAGVTVRGMEADSTAVRVFPSDPTRHLFSALPGQGAALLEKMELHGANEANAAILESMNPSMVLQKCYLYVVIDYEVFPPVVCASTNLTVRQCDIFCRGVWETELVSSFGSPSVLFEDCIIDVNDIMFLSLNPGTVLTLKNNTFLRRASLAIGDLGEYSIFYVNNIFCDGAACYTTWPLPTVAEWRYNDFVSRPPEPGCGYQIGNFSADPLFCTQYRLEPESPCIGAGEGGENVGARRGICWPPSALSEDEGAGLDATRITGVWPNPAYSDVTIELEGGRAPVRVEVLDVTGRVVRALTTDEAVLRWDGCGADGRKVASGVYYLRLPDAPSGRPARILMLR